MPDSITGDHLADVRQLQAALTLLQQVSRYILEHLNEPAIRQLGELIGDDWDRLTRMPNSATKLQETN